MEHSHGSVSHDHRRRAMLTEIDHVGIAVADLEATVGWYQRMFGATVAHRERIESDGVDEALIKVADSYIQLLTPYTDTSPLAKCMETQRRGHPPRRLPGRRLRRGARAREGRGRTRRRRAPPHRVAGARRSPSCTPRRRSAR